MRASTFQRIDIPLSRDLQTDYDKIIQLTEHLDAITAVGDMVENGVDFNELLTLTSTVEDHTTALDGKVDKVAGSSLMTDAERAKLQFIAQQATKNQTDTYLVDRANHTGTQNADTLTDGVVNVAMTINERSRLAAMDDEANNYVHPTSHPVSILDGGVNYNKVVKTDALGNVGFGDTSWADVVGKPSTYTPNAHEHSMDEVTSGTISATRVVPTETRQFVNASQLASIADMELQTNKGIPNGYAPLNANGKINASYVGDLNLMEVFTPNDLNSMLNLTSAQPGDIAYRLDTGNSYMLIALPSSLEANWKQLNSGAGVVSVNGLDGIVTLGSANVPESGTNYYFTNERVDDRVTGLLQAGTNISLAYDDAANTLTVNANDVSVDWSEIQNKPDPVVTVTLTGDVTGTANATLTDLGNGTITVATTVAANSVALGTDTTGNYAVGVTAGAGITVTGTAGEGWSPTIAHADTSSATSIASNNSNGVVIQDVTVTLDTYGHATTVSVGTIDLDTRYYTETEVQTVLPKIGFDTANVTPPSTGQMAWNQDEKTIDVGINGVILQMGQELMTNVRNNTGSLILNKTVLMATGTIGASGRVTVAPYAGGDPKYILGIATEDIGAGLDGFVTSFGKVRGINTSMWAEGAVLYATTAGGLTATEPTTGVKVPVAFVVVSHASVGTLFVRVTPIDLNAYQPKDAALTSISALTTAADKMIYTTALDTYATATITAAARTVLDDASVAAMRTTLGISATNTPSTAIGGVVATNVQAAIAELDSEMTSVNLLRADKYLAAQNIVAMLYTGSDLTKIQYIAATDVNYEVLGYVSGNLTTINHYVASVLKGTTTLTYSNGTLVSAVYA